MPKIGSDTPSLRPTQNAQVFNISDEARKAEAEKLKNEILGALRSRLDDSSWQGPVRVSVYNAVNEKTGKSELYVVLSGEQNDNLHVDVFHYDDITKTPSISGDRWSDVYAYDKKKHPEEHAGRKKQKAETEKAKIKSPGDLVDAAGDGLISFFNRTTGGTQENSKSNLKGISSAMPAFYYPGEE